MKKFLCLAIAMVILFTACRSSQKIDSLPEHIVGDDYELTRVESPIKGETVTTYSRYLSLSEKDIVENSALIAKIAVIGEPIEYEVECSYSDKQITQIYQAKILELYQSDNSELKQGDIILISRRDYMISQFSNKKFCDAEYIKTNPDETYILFLESLKHRQEKEAALAASAKMEPENYYSAVDEIADYMVFDDLRAIIYCVGDTYEFSTNLPSLAEDAESKINTITRASDLIHYFVTDKDFDHRIETMLHSYANE